MSRYDESGLHVALISNPEYGVGRSTEAGMSYKEFEEICKLVSKGQFIRVLAPDKDGMARRGTVRAFDQLSETLVLTEPEFPGPVHYTLAQRL